jgi:hypothetical protein
MACKGERDMDLDMARAGIAPQPLCGDDEVPCAQHLCGDGYTQHVVDGELGACTVCLCPGFLWVPPMPTRR